MSIISKKTPDEVLSILLLLVDKGLVMPTENIEVFLKTGKSINEDVTGTVFEFLHDRIHDAVYALITDEQKKVMHYEIGSVLLNSLESHEIEDRIMNIMTHINRAPELINEQDRIQMAKYNLAAGRKAASVATFNSALKYFTVGKWLLPDDSWIEYPKLSYDLYFEFAKYQFLCGNHSEAQEIFQMLLKKAKSKVEIAEIYGTESYLFIYLGNYDEAIKKGIKAINVLGFKLSAKPGKLQIIVNTLISLWHFRDSKVKSIFNMRENNSPEVEKILDLMTSLAPATFSCNPDLFIVILLKLCVISIKYGNTKYAPIGYMGYGIISGSVLGNYQKARGLQKTALLLAKKYNSAFTQCLVNFIDAAFVNHWTQHGQSSITKFQNGIRYGIESGEYLFAAYSASVQMEFTYCLGMNLNKICKECQDAIELTRSLHVKVISDYLPCFRQMVIGVRSGNLNSFDNESLIDQVKQNDYDLMTFYLLKMQAYYLYEKSGCVIDLIEMAQPKLEDILGLINYAEHIFYHSLIITANYDQLSGSMQKKYRRLLKNNLKKLKQWSNNCQENFLHKYLLVAAESARIGVVAMEAADLYDQAIRSAAENRYLQNEAIANELAGKFFLSMNRHQIASVYLNNAYTKYQLWGAEGKTNALKEKYGRIINELTVSAQPIVHLNELEVQKSTGAAFNKVFKTIQNISDENDITMALIKLFSTIIEITGADKGYMLIEKNDELYIEACKESAEQPLTAADLILQENCESVPVKVIRYVDRTLETVISSNNSHVDILAVDPYLTGNKPDFIACLPLLMQGVYAGVIYLEKNSGSKLLTAECIEAIKVLINHMVIIEKLQQLYQKESETKQSNILLAEKLTKRELEVLGCIVNCKSNKEIAADLGLSTGTVKTHVLNIYQKLGVNRRIQAVTRAKELGLF